MSDPILTRRSFAQRCLWAAPATLAVTRDAVFGAEEKTAKPVSVAEAFDEAMTAFMEPRGFPGGALAVVREGRLVYARGYGWADREAQKAVTTKSLFRIASISKPITALAILKLVQDGKLKLENRAFDL